MSRRWLVAPLPIVMLAGIGLMPVETRQGIDYEVRTYRIPLYAKLLDFAQRDSSYTQLVQRIVSDEQTPEARALALFGWTVAQIHDTPAGFPVVDDHVSHIIIRGYGVDDQKADVFTTLATYADVPAFWSLSRNPPGLPISWVWIDGQWRVFDVANRIVFRNRQGGLASFDELRADGAWLDQLLAARTYRGRPYIDYFRSVTLEPPDVLRAEQQMLAPRAWIEVKRRIGLGGREWQP